MGKEPEQEQEEGEEKEKEAERKAGKANPRFISDGAYVRRGATPYSKYAH